jgi:hypothetical protein
VKSACEFKIDNYIIFHASGWQALMCAGMMMHEKSMRISLSNLPKCKQPSGSSGIQKASKTDMDKHRNYRHRLPHNQKLAKKYVI